MDVVLTKHAWIRCKQRHIDPYQVKILLEQIPYFTGESMWRVCPNIVAIISNVGGKCVVVTVHDGRMLSKDAYHRTRSGRKLRR
jgi:hypothetical protein